MKKKIIIIGSIIAAIVVGIVISILVYNASHSDEISEEQWVLNQRTHINHLVNLSETIDDVYTLYIMGVMSAGDFNNEMQIIQVQYNVYLKEFEQQANEDKIKLGSETSISKKGRQALYDLNEDYASLIKDTYTEAMTPKSPEEVAYIKMAYLQNIEDHFIRYLAAYNVILETNPDVSEPEGNFELLISHPERSEMFDDPITESSISSSSSETTSE